MRDKKRNSISEANKEPKPELEFRKAEAEVVSSQSAEAKAWKSENRDAIQAINDWVEVNGIPLSELRQF